MKDIQELLKKLWSGEASELEKIRLYKLISKDAETGVVYRLLETKFMQGDETGTLEDSALGVLARKRILDTLHGQIGMDTIAEQPLLKAVKVNNGRIAWWSAAACLFVVFSLLWNHKDRHVAPHNLAQYAVPHHLSTDSTVSNGGNSSLHLMLPDSSSVVLEKNGSVTFKKDMVSQERRTIHLKGAASFSVRHDENHLFEVLAHGIRTVDVGTVFYIDASSLLNLKIHLMEGAIKVEALAESSMQFSPMYMQPGQELVMNLTTGNFCFSHPEQNKNPVNRKMPDPSGSKGNTQQLYDQYMDRYTDVTFTEESLAVVFEKMTELYRIKNIHLQSSVPANQPFTGTLVGEDPLGKALDLICRLSDLSYKVDGTGTIQVYKSKNKY